MADELKMTEVLPTTEQSPFVCASCRILGCQAWVLLPEVQRLASHLAAAYAHIEALERKYGST